MLYEMNCLLIFHSIFLLIPMVNAMERGDPSEYYPLPYYPKQPIRLMPTPGNPSPNIDDLLNDIFKDIQHHPRSSVSDIRNKHRPVYLAFSPPGESNPVDHRCRNILDTDKSKTTINFVLACQFIQHYVEPDLLQPSELKETNVANFGTIHKVYEKLIRNPPRRFEYLVYEQLREYVTVNNIRGIMDNCDREILSNQTSRHLYLVVTCDFIKAYQNGIIDVIE